MPKHILKKSKLISEKQKLISKSQKLISKVPKLISKRPKLISAGFHLSGLDWISHKKKACLFYPLNSGGTGKGSAGFYYDVLFCCQNIRTKGSFLKGKNKSRNFLLYHKRFPLHNQVKMSSLNICILVFLLLCTG